MIHTLLSCCDRLIEWHDDDIALGKRVWCGSNVDEMVCMPEVNLGIDLGIAWGI